MLQRWVYPVWLHSRAWQRGIPNWKCCNIWWCERLIYLLLSRTNLKYSHCTSDKPFVNIAGLPLAKRRGMQRWQLCTESAVVYATSVSLQHMWDTAERPQPWGRVHAERRAWRGAVSPGLISHTGHADEHHPSSRWLQHCIERTHVWGLVSRFWLNWDQRLGLERGLHD